ncbi:MAG: tRNA (guanosine(46)-N7)-methyltransferase TrmB [Crocinitomicaceae bacterium]|jgi:tRNA (guanine-N7-)-methyltransferase|nr:tRNA (guanosine(46)-N7)-methyltransferase TrmB [Crocinitomicaceae bacterium]MBT5404030.1 tRNA (guanosine(46)-N7)-methyltransferase TrmB [Crocinitomicaceae bacterium]MBT6029286.1 tRNA (guanosine(46)-N7)-methyltransferase TrmB [Crocinitomicaceae bacterium]MBT6514281.1 tRNA (guanosine(46)-N7)-methyltransferase TrmB [Crocinitomicaceae bacterium]MDG2330998.1 tRNA (guanosine(46)-N7)-methyltransferase TrmB [Flavobacteriales bacterium]
MASKNKLERFAEMESFKNIFQPAIDSVKEADFELKGKWAEHFGNNHPIVLELGCGKGEYTIGLAKRYPEKNFIGMDIKGARIWKGAKQGEQEGITNACFIRTKIDFITQFFHKNEVSEIWCTFSDPQPKKPNKRLTSKVFVERYKQFLKKDGIIHLKTDSDLLMASTEEEISSNKYQELFKTWDLYGEGVYALNDEIRDILEIRTFYEDIWLKEGKTIKYIKFQVATVS